MKNELIEEEQEQEPELTGKTFKETEMKNMCYSNTTRTRTRKGQEHERSLSRVF